MRREQQYHQTWGRLSAAQHQHIDHAAAGLDREKMQTYFLRVHCALRQIRGRPSNDDVDHAIAKAKAGLIQTSERDVARETLP